MKGLNEYAKMINRIFDAGFSAELNWHSRSNKPKLFLRHDIDFSIDLAYELAKFESDIGVRSTYFFMLTSNMYNIFSNKNADIVKKIKVLGHKISIHYDPTCYKDDQGFVLEKQIFEMAFGENVDIYSIHRPGNFLNDNNRMPGGVYHTYHDRFFREMKYLSDSGGRNVVPIVDEFIRQRPAQDLHLLIHPIWWFEKGSTVTNVLDTWLERRTRFLKGEIRDNCKTYKG